MLFKLYLKQKTALMKWNQICSRLYGPLRNLINPITFFFGFLCVIELNKILSRSTPITKIIEDIAALLLSMTDKEKNSLRYKYDADTNSYKFKLDSTEQNNISFDISIDQNNKIKVINLTFVMDIGERVDFIIVTYNISLKQYEVSIKAHNVTLNYSCVVDNNYIRVSVDNQKVHMSAEDIIRSAILKTMVNMFTINIPKIIEVEVNEERKERDDLKQMDRSNPRLQE